MMYVGIDIGHTGAVAFLDSVTNKIEVFKTTENRELIFHQLLNLPPGSIVGLEDLHAVFKAQASSTFSFGKAAGFWEGIIALLEYLKRVQGSRVHFIKPVDWQKAVTNKPPKPKTRGLESKTRVKMNKAHKTALKVESCEAVKRSLGLTLDDHNCCDACNLARYLKYLYERKGW